jgi:hypothetical protein
VILARDSGFLMTYASTVDLEEAYKVGQKAVLVAAEEGAGSALQP